jgi:Rap1a immunity proteins
MQRLAHGSQLFCLPPHAGPQEKFRVVRQYMARHPETLSIEVGMMVVGALAQAYPCPPKR